MNSFINYYRDRGHVFGECWSKSDTDLMYINIPKNATSWTKPNLQDWGWECYNYHTDNLYHKKALVVLREPVDRWISGIAEYMYLYHRQNVNYQVMDLAFVDLVFDKIAFDDHTEKQIYFLDGIDLNNCVFFKFGPEYRQQFSTYLDQIGMPNKYHQTSYRHVSNDSEERRSFKNIFSQQIKTNSKYLDKVKQYFKDDYDLINTTKFHGSK